MLNLNSLNDKQLEAVTFESGNLLVLAGPGSGKTYTIVQRIYYLIDRLKVSPDKILVISFTKDSALEMQNRFLSGSDIIHPVVFGTFHSIFYHILLDVYGKSLKLLTATYKKRIINDILKQRMSDKLYFSEQNDLSECILNAISYYKNTLDADSAVSLLDSQYTDIFDIVLTEYERRRRTENAIDFDDMVYDCLNLLEKNKQAFNKWNGRFSYILIDEFQDINPVQYKVIKLLINNNTKLFLVGDDDQSIYGFRGSRPECMKLAIDECNCSIINLQYNYRNTEQIRKIAEAIIKDNISRINKASVSKNPRNDINHIYVFGYENKEMHYDAIADKLYELNGKTAILFRTNIEMQRMAILLGKRGIPYICKEKKQNIYEHFIVKDIMAYLQLSQMTKSINEQYVYKESSELVARIINKPIRYINRESLIGLDNPLNNALRYYQNISDKNLSKKIILNINILKKDLSFINERSIYPAITYILKKIGYQKYILECAKNDKHKQEEYNEIIEWILDDSKHYETLDEYIEAQNEYNDELRNSEKNADNSSDAVLLMTVHASKGLEFKNVIIAECNEGNFPHGKMIDEKTVEEERRLFYVAVTRSSENLFIYYIKGTKERIAVPSRFINRILDKSNTKNPE